jgi:fused signal recognition particle receptor
MFDQLRKAFTNATRSIIQKELSEKDVDVVLSDLEIALLQSDIAQEVIDVLVTELKSELIGTKLEKGQEAENIVQVKFRNAIVEMFSKAGEVDLLGKIKEKKERKGGPFVITFLGINGTGKTTTVAKVARLLHANNISVVLAAGDTHRAGAIEQISLHAEKLSLKVIAQRYGADPSAVGRDAIDYAKKHYIDAVLVDTAGRMQTAKNLMDEINKIVRIVKPDFKLFVGDSLAGNDTINQAREFFEYTNFDGAILTKIDADAKGGSALSIVHITSRPIIYLGVGQGYDDIIPFDVGRFIDSIFRDVPLNDALNKTPPTVIGDAPSPDGLFKDRQQMVNTEAQELSDQIKIPDNADSLTQFEDHPVVQGEKHGPEQDKLVQARPQAPFSQDDSSAFDSSSPIDNSRGKNKKTRLGGLFGRWTRVQDKTRAEETAQRVDGKLETMSRSKGLYQSGKIEAKGKESSSQGRQADRQESRGSDEKERKRKDDGETVYLSNEDIEDMLK